MSSLVVDLTQQQPAPVEQLEAELYLARLEFRVSRKDFPQQLQLLNQYAPYLAARPALQVSLSLEGEQGEAPFKAVAVGGTFDHLHIGHFSLLGCTALATSHRIVVGLTSPALLAKKQNVELIQSYQLRGQRVAEFVRSVNPGLKIQVAELLEPYGPAITDGGLEAIVLSEETWGAGAKINEIRQERGMSALALLKCPTLVPEGVGLSGKVSSTQRRNYLLAKSGLSLEEWMEYRGWFEGVLQRGKAEGVQGEEWWERVVGGYSEHWRHYHTNRHVYDMLRQYRSQPRPATEEERTALQVAVWFHDVVYRPDRSDNEQQSAALALQFVEGVFGGHPQHTGLGRRVEQLVVETKTHQPSSALSVWLYELDMAILNADQAVYRQYARNVSREYLPLVGQDYWGRRREFLESLRKQQLHFSRPTPRLLPNIDWEVAALAGRRLE